MTLEQQLEYFWERQVYSVLKDSNGKYCIVSTRNHDLGFRFSGFFPTIDIAKDYIGAFGRWENMVSDCILELCTIVDTIHPSELMGNGFQVGDKVLLITGNGTTKESVVTNVANDGGDGNVYELKCYPHVSFPHMRLKPVLPVEEREVCMKCGATINPNDIGVLRTGTDYLCCYSCDKEVIKVIELLKKTKVIKDGHIVNL